MAIYKRDIADINLETGNIHRTFLNHSIGSGDNNANAFGVRLFRDNEPVNIGSGWVQGFFRNSHGENIALTQHGVIDGNEAYVTLPQACYNYEGQFTLAIKIVSPGSANTVTMRIVDGIVDNTNTGSAVAPTGTVPTYQEVLAAYEQAVTVIDKSVRFDTTQSLTDTQKATARTNIGAASVGTANELAMDIGALAEGFANESYMDLGNKYMPFRRGYYSTPAVGSTSSYQSNSQYFYALVMCQPGDILHAHCYGNSTVYAWAFLDSNLNVLSRGGTGNFEGTQTAPASTSYVLVNVDISHMSTGFYAWVGKESTGEKISDLKSAISILGYQKKEYNVTAGSQHSSDNDICYINIPAGTKYTVSITPNPSGAITSCAIFAKYSDGTDSNRKTQTSFPGTFSENAVKDIIGIGLFSTAAQVAQNGIIKVEVTINSTGLVMQDISDLKPLKDELRGYEFAGQSDVITSWYSKTSDAVTNNNDGTFTIETNGFGTIVFKKLHLLPGVYKLYGVSGNGYSYLSTGTNYTTRFVTNNTGAEMGVTITEERDCYLGFRNSAKPSASYVITPYLVEDRIVSIKNNIRDIELENSKTVTATVLGADVPANASAIFNLSSGYITVLKSAIDAWMGEYAGDVQKVPFIVHTDQHGLLDADYKGLFDLISYLVNWDEVSAIFNLGDTVTDKYIETAGMTNPLLRCAELEEAMNCLSSVPKIKQINMYGNHDTWYTGNIPTPVAHTLPDMKYLNPYFISTGLRTIRQEDNSNLQVVYDDRNKIKYICIADWDYANRGSSSQYAYTLFWISPDHWRWIINEMTKNEGYSIVLVSHVPTIMGSSIAYDPITSESRTLTTPELIVAEREQFNVVWTARKNKTSGSITVKDEVISYDFTGCTDDCLCVLSGHTHYDGIDYVGGSDGLLQVCFDRLLNYTVHFGLIDKRNSRVNVWKVSNDSSTPAVQNWQAPFDYQST